METNLCEEVSISRKGPLLGLSPAWLEGLTSTLTFTVGADKNETLIGLEVSKTPPTCKVLIILSQVMALPKKQCFEIIEDLLIFRTKLSIKIIFAIFNFL